MSREQKIVKVTKAERWWTPDEKRDIRNADIVIDSTNQVTKDRQGVSGRRATAAEVRRATVIS